MRGREWQILAMGAGASLPKIATGFLAAENSPWFSSVLQKISVQHIVCYSVYPYWQDETLILPY